MKSLDAYIQALNDLSEQGLIDAKPAVLTFKTGEIIFHVEEPATRIYGIKTGKVQLVRYLENGQVSNQCAVQESAWFGERALFNDVYTNSAIATQTSQIIAISKNSFLTLLRHDPEISLTFISQLTDQLSIAKNLMALRCIRSAYGRVLAYLQSLRMPGQNTYVLTGSIKSIAEQICLTPEVVSRSLRKLQEDGVIQRQQRRITFLDP